MENSSLENTTENFEIRFRNSWLAEAEKIFNNENEDEETDYEVLTRAMKCVQMIRCGGFDRLPIKIEQGMNMICDCYYDSEDGWGVRFDYNDFELIERNQILQWICRTWNWVIKTDEIRNYGQRFMASIQ